jgi:hypothetical protein
VKYMRENHLEFELFKNDVVLDKAAIAVYF